MYVNNGDGIFVFLKIFRTPFNTCCLKYWNIAQIKRKKIGKQENFKDSVSGLVSSTGCPKKIAPMLLESVETWEHFFGTHGIYQIDTRCIDSLLFVPYSLACIYMMHFKIMINYSYFQRRKS